MFVRLARWLGLGGRGVTSRLRGLVSVSAQGRAWAFAAYGFVPLGACVFLRLRRTREWGGKGTPWMTVSKVMTVIANGLVYRLPHHTILDMDGPAVALPADGV